MLSSLPIMLFNAVFSRFPFFLDPLVAVVVCQLVCVEFGLDVVLGVIGVAIHGVDGSSIPDDQMRYAILWRICRWYTMSWEYKSCRSLAPLLSRASDTRVKIL